MGRLFGLYFLAQGAAEDLRNHQNIQGSHLANFILVAIATFALNWFFEGHVGMNLLQVAIGLLIILALSKRAWSPADGVFAAGSLFLLPQMALFFIGSSAFYWAALSIITRKKQTTFVPFILAGYLTAWVAQSLPILFGSL